MRLGADPDRLDDLAAALHRASEDLAARAAAGRGRVAALAWAGPDADVVARRLQARVVAPLRAASVELARLGRVATAAAREQRRASEHRPGVVLQRRTAAGDGVLVQRVGRGDARTVVLLVPGVGTDPGDRARLAADAGAVWSAVTGAGATPGDVAVVSWLGYDPPDHVVGAVDPRPAARGADELVAEVAALRERGARRVTVVGHSYGGVVVARALERGMDADAAVLLGAPGAGAAAEVGRSRGVVVAAARADGDPIGAVVPLARPVHGADPLEGTVVLPTSRPGHSSYLRDPVLLDALAGIAAVPGSTPRPVHRYGRAAAARPA